MKLNIPTKITLARIFLVLALLIFLFVCSFMPEAGIWRPFGNSGVCAVTLIATIVFIVASATDYLDGHLARKWNQVTDLGKFLDPIADKMLVNSTLVFLCFLYPHSAVLWFCVVLMIIRDLVVDTLRFLAAKKGVVLAANIFGKAKTVLQMVAIPFALLGGWPFTYFDSSWGYGRFVYLFIYAATAMSLISGFIYVKSNLNVLKESPKE